MRSMHHLQKIREDNQRDYFQARMMVLRDLLERARCRVNDPDLENEIRAEIDQCRKDRWM